MSDKVHLLGMSRSTLEEFAASLGEPKYRATQVFKALHQRRLTSFDDISDLPKKLRVKLEASAEISTLSVGSRFVSNDGTRRYLMKTKDGFPV
jgi:23S rRNA (adenine2503-C2)-methyltransferase